MAAVPEEAAVPEAEPLGIRKSVPPQTPEKKTKKKGKPCGDFFIDSHGSIRRYMTTVRDRKGEAKRVGKADDAKEGMGKEWAIIDKAWMYQWLNFVWDETKTVHAPPPVSNKELLKLEWDMAKSLYDEGGDPGTALRIVVKDGIKVKENYRRISTGVWEAFMDLYGGGPPIVATSAKGVPMEEMLTGLQDTSKWSVVIHLLNGQTQDGEGEDEAEWQKVQQDLEAIAPCHYDVDELLEVLMDKAIKKYENHLIELGSLTKNDDAGR
jgi:hypothetical protein